MAAIIGILLLILGVFGIKYGIEAIIVGLTFLAIACGLRRD